MDEETEKKEFYKQNELSELIRDTETIFAIFNEPTNLLKDLKDSYDRKSYSNTIENASKVLTMMEQPTEQFIKYGTAFSISAAGNWVSTLREVGVDITHAEELLSKATEQFIVGDFQQANQIMKEVKDIIHNLEGEQRGAAEEGISSTERLVEEAKGIEANVDEAERNLQQAKNFFETENYPEMAKFLGQAKEKAERARQKRIQSVSDALLFTRSVIDESKEVGVDTSEPEALFKEAKSAFGSGDFVKCSELTKQAEEKALQLQDQHIQKVLELKEKRATMGRREQEAVVEPTEKPGTSEENCPTCGQTMRYVQKYNRHWCSNCKKYGPKK